MRENKTITIDLGFSPQSKNDIWLGHPLEKSRKSHVMLLRVDVDSLRVAVMTFARASVLVAHLIVKGVHLLTPGFPNRIRISTVQSPAVYSIRVLETANFSFFELSLQRQLFGLK